MTEQVLEVLGKLDKRNTRNIIWVTLEQAKLIIYIDEIRVLISTQ